MTWVVGGRHVMCVRALADTQVTLEYPNGTSKPCGAVQKIHRLNNDIVIAFADSLFLGFLFLKLLKDEFVDQLDRRWLNDPARVANKISKFLKFQYLKKNCTKRVEIMIFIRPRQPNAVSFGLWKAVSPKFVLIEPAGPFAMLEIGSGRVVNQYRDLVDRNSRGYYEIPGENGEKPTAIIPIGKVAIQYLFAEALEYEVAGVSKSMHLMMMTSDGTKIHERTSEIDAPFPVVAKTWRELQEMLKEKGIDTLDCTAVG